MNVNDMAKLIKTHNNLLKMADLFLPGMEHDGTIFNYMDISEIIMNNLGKKYSAILKIDDGVDQILYLINDQDMTYIDRAKELLK